MASLMFDCPSDSVHFRALVAIEY